MALWTGFPAGVGLPGPNDPCPAPRKALKCQAKSADFERKISGHFVLPEEMLSNASPNTTSLDSGVRSDSGSILLNMPFEILLTIYDTVGHAPSQTALALSCKRMAAAAGHVRFALSTTSARYAGFLPRSVFDVPDLMAQLRPWMPADLRLCNHCLTYRPRHEGYWDTVAGCEVSNFWIQKTGWTFHDAGWHKQVHDICPACHVACTLSDYSDCDGCRTLGRLGDVDWARVSDPWRRPVEEELRAGRFAT